MAGVNNQPNLKPIIDSQTEAQQLEFSWLKGVAASNRTKLDKLLLDVLAVSDGANSNHEASQLSIESLKTDTAQIVTDKHALLDAAITAAKNAILADLIAKTDALQETINNLPVSPVKSVQRGSAYVSGSILNVTISPVNTDKAFVIVSTRGETGGVTSTLSSSKIQITQGTSNSGYVDWQVIEYA